VRKIWEVLDWSVAHGLASVDALNERIARGEFPKSLRESDSAYEQTWRTLWSSSKRGATRSRSSLSPGRRLRQDHDDDKLGLRLEHIGLKLVALNVDNYFFDLALHPQRTNMATMT